jgi:hypothetical protein
MSGEEKGRTDRRTFIRTAGAVGAGAGVALTGATPAAAATGPDVGTASWNNFGGATILNPGASAGWWYSFSGDPGFQIAGPNILAPQNGATHTFFNFGKGVTNGSAVYFVTVRNDSGVQAVHNLQGGGVT